MSKTPSQHPQFPTQNLSNESSCQPGCGCGTPGLARRDFLKTASLAAASLALPGLPAVAGPFEGADFTQLIPADKKLDPRWVRSLYERGEPTVYRGDALRHIGMPVGGICAGQLYLGGDGRLWHWDLFNLPQAGHFTSSGGPNYAKPPAPGFPIEQGFAIRLTTAGRSQTRAMDSRDFNAEHIAFRGQYPVAFVDYADPAWPVTIRLEAFSPFVPLDVESSTLPATILRYTVRNKGAQPAEIELAGWIENGVCLGLGSTARAFRRNRVLREDGLTMLHQTAESTPEAQRPPARPDLVFEDFEPGYSRWTIEGEAFGKEPAAGTLPSQQAVGGFVGKRLVNTFLRGDVTTGRAVSKDFTIERRCIAFKIGGGSQAGQTCFNLIVDGRQARTATGHDNEALEWSHWDVSEFAGRTARLEIVDRATGPWGHINLDQITFCDEPPADNRRVEEREDFGSMGLALLGPAAGAFACSRLTGAPVETLFSGLAGPESDNITQSFGSKLIGAVGRKLTLAPGQEADVTFVLSWHFAGLPRRSIGGLIDVNRLRRSYSAKFDTAAAVARHVAAHFDKLAGQTRLWNRTWYDSSLPWWLMDRTLIPVCTLATSTCYLFDTGRFYAFEGVLCCQGTCQHVWNYAQSVGRLFPQLERDLRARTDFGTAWHENGATDYRGECARHVAHDGQCGVILRTYREHLMAPDADWLKRIWPRVRASVEYLIRCDRDENGLIEGEQYNTLDAAWWGPMAWISSFYIAALRAGEAMALEMGDDSFAVRCRTIAERGSAALVSQLYDGEYFIHQPDPKHPEGTNTNRGCHIDQLMGQAWAMQVGLPRIVPVAQSLSALEAMWKYNFTPDVGPFRQKSLIKGGRWYAMAGEGGVVMTTFPKGGVEQATGKGGFAHYFNEVWTGQEHQLAAHMLNEGMVEKALVITRFVHDRHHAARRNPYNEVECSDHYTRAMSSHGTFLAACGYEYHGPKGHIVFAPRLKPEDFRAPFTAAEGWGTYTQKTAPASMEAELAVYWGRVRLRTVALAPQGALAPTRIQATLGGRALTAKVSVQNQRALIDLGEEVTIETGQSLKLALA